MRNRIMQFAFVALAIGLAGINAAGTDLTIGAGGRVTIELISSSAQFRNTLSIASPAVSITLNGCKLEPADGLPGTRLFSEKLSQRGCRVELDADPATPGIQAFASGTTFRFNFCAQTNADPACEFVWSSNQASNSDSFDHLITTPIRPAEFPGQIFRLNWEDFPGGGDRDFNDLIAVLRVSQDTDGDGLWDDWERFGVDTNGDGTADLDLPGLGANPNHKDIFLEIDFMDCTVPGGDCAPGNMHSHQPNAAAVAIAVMAFANAPVMNPDGMTGVTLHIDVSNAIRHQTVLNFNGGAGVGDFDDVKNDVANFGSSSPRRFAYHYALFTHNEAAGSTVSGRGEQPGNDFYVSLGGWAGDVGSVQQQAGTLMHELGHNLNLAHGGGDGVNNKPNYLSVMNYTFQTTGIPPIPRFDYSRSALANLIESSLNESTGIMDGTDSTRYACPGGMFTVGAGMGSIDWNCDTDVMDMGFSGDINGDGTIGTLTGFDDWANLKYDFQNAGNFEDGDHSTSELLIESNLPTQQRQALADVSISISPSASSAVTGTNVSYTIRVTNNGPERAVGVMVKDVLPSTTMFSNCVANAGGVCGGSGNDRLITFLGIDPATTATIVLEATVNCSVANGVTFNNMATVTSETVDPVISNNAAQASIMTINPPPVITQPANINVVSAKPGDMSVVVNYPIPMVTDNCPGVTITYSMASGSTFPLGTTVVTVKATDSGGATSTVTFNVTVWDASIQDDRGLGTLLFNSFTGEYLFIRCGPGGFTIAGIGIISRVGCLLKLDDDTRVTAAIDRCTIAPLNRGTASIKPVAVGTTFDLKDSNILGNKVLCP